MKTRYPWSVPQRSQFFTTTPVRPAPTTSYPSTPRQSPKVFVWNFRGGNRTPPLPQVDEGRRLFDKPYAHTVFFAPPHGSRRRFARMALPTHGSIRMSGPHPCPVPAPRGTNRRLPSTCARTGLIRKMNGERRAVGSTSPRVCVMLCELPCYGQVNGGNATICLYGLLWNADTQADTSWKLIGFGGFRSRPTKSARVFDGAPG